MTVDKNGFLQPHRKLRPLTAGPGRKSQHRHSLSMLHEVQRPSTAVAELYADRFKIEYENRTPTAHRPASAWKEKQKIKTKIMRKRRLTVGPYLGLSCNPELLWAKERAEDQEPDAMAKIEDRIQLEHLNQIRELFKAAADADGGINLNKFKDVMKLSLSLKDKNEDQIEALFMKIDSESNEVVSWEKFCTYMQLEYAEKEDSVARQRQVTFHVPPLQETHPHREHVFKLCSGSSDSTVISISQDGMLAYWTPSMKIKRLKSIMTEQNSSRRKPKWITDFVMLPSFKKFLISTGDRELQFYELTTYEAYCQITSLETVPLKLDFCHLNDGESLVLFGDGLGCVHILIFSNLSETLRTWKKSKHEGIASVTIESVIYTPNIKYIQWQVHKDWVTSLKYFSNIRQVISSSNDDNTALVIGCAVGSTNVESELKERTNRNSTKRVNQLSLFSKERLPHDQLKFYVYKGVKAFDFDKDKNILVTGGMDRTVRIFNPYIPSKPNAILKGHNAPICYVTIAASESRIFSVSTEKMIKVWDIQEQTCLITVRPKMHMIKGDMQTVFYNPQTKALLMVADNKIASLQLICRTEVQKDVPVSHREPVTCARYNKAFNQVISCSESSVVKVWDLRTGQDLFEFSKAHVDDEGQPTSINCISFDESYRRLITGGRDGILKIWNYNNGNCLKKLIPRKLGEVTDCIYLNVNKSRKVISVGWDRHINVFLDSGADYKMETEPEEFWPDDIRKGHKEDILCVTMSKPNLLATSSYDGVAIVWNMISGRTLSRLIAPKPEDYAPQSLDGDLSINKLIFIESRNLMKGAASLVTSGPYGMIHFWNIYSGGQLYGRMYNTPGSVVNVSAMALTRDEAHLFTADAKGFIRVWDIKSYCISKPHSDAPVCLIKWRAHVESIRTLELVEEKKLILSASKDCSVRVWTVAGEYVGTFGQIELWDITDPDSYAHPHVPYDVLVDPGSIPDPTGEAHLPLEQRTTFYEYTLGETNSNNNDKVKETLTSHSVDDFMVTDKQIAVALLSKSFITASGKRLRHERHKRRGRDRTQNLACYEIEDSPAKQPNRPYLNRYVADELF